MLRQAVILLLHLVLEELLALPHEEVEVGWHPVRIEHGFGGWVAQVGLDVGEFEIAIQRQVLLNAQLVEQDALELNDLLQSQEFGVLWCGAL